MRPAKMRMSRAFLTPGLISIWTLPSASLPDTAVVRGLLNPEERARSDRFRSADDARQWMATRAALRLALSGYTRVPPVELSFATRGRGKPFAAGFTEVCFSASHTRGLALIAITRGVDIGVDVEQVDGDRVDLDAARLVLSEAEAASIDSAPLGQQSQAFFQAWTRKEAFAKATGEGLTPRLPEITLRIGRTTLGRNRLTLLDLDLGPGYAGAIACLGDFVGVDVAEFDWEE